MSQGFDFLGFRIQWKRKRGTNKWYVYTFIADRPFRSVKAKIRALTPRTSQHDLRALLIRINQITRGWTNYFKHAIAQRTFSKLQHHTWSRIVRMMRTRHRWKWTGRPSLAHRPHRPVASDQRGRDRVVQPRDDTDHSVTATGATRSPTPGSALPEPTHGRNHGEPGAVKVARRVRRAAWGNGPSSNAGHLAPGRLNPAERTHLADERAPGHDRARGHGFHVVAADCSSPDCWLRRRASASRACDLTVPTEMPRAAAVSASVRSSK